MESGVITAAYLVAAVLFIQSLSGLSTQETARRGNWLGIIGMLLAVAVTLAGGHIGNWTLLIPALGVGAVVGAMLAARVEMTAMPQLVAMLHSFVGAAAVLVGISNYLAPGHEAAGFERVIHEFEICAGVFIGALTFTGSVAAFAKLQGIWGSKPLLLPGRHALNLVALLACVPLMIWFMNAPEPTGLTPLLVITVIALLLGIHGVAAIGSADMPVVVSMLNSYSGWAAAAAGFLLDNDLLIITGALVGSSGAILSYIMCRAMNRRFVSVILGGFGQGAGKASPAANGEPQGQVVPTSAEEVAGWLGTAKEVVVVPGYGMAVAQAQYALGELMKKLQANGTRMRFAIHPVAGRLPGHMNVLLAEARIPYDVVLEMDEINADFPSTDVVLVIGSNDIVNPAALDDIASPIYGMPVLEVWKAKTTVIFKRSMASGYSGIDNPLFYLDNSRMLFGDAKASVDALLANMHAD
ncbi:MAG: NAD(P)(+) transhydrogenase (Re/Si-specific) subunit beta [Acidobacteria bacterium]|nr:NAD(P)(+) transhydrogenase (Re/Si-specific) subunit beta [Acidobacteriota bacterium]MDA1235520.1 NAD(P)(+) transhydrogenase (Re/Si-specific) subunit beta [Acidobacteriota bacterium]